MKDNEKLLTRSHPVDVAVVVFVLCMVVIIYGGQYLLVLEDRGFFNSWEQVKLPSGQAVHLYQGENGEVLLEMSDGRLFEWDRENSPPWIEVETPTGFSPFFFGFVCIAEKGDYYMVSEPSQKVVDRIIANCYGPESGAHYEFILTEGGEVLMWQRGSFMPGSLIRRTIACIGGVVISLVFTTIAYSITRMRSRQVE